MSEHGQEERRKLLALVAGRLDATEAARLRRRAEEEPVLGRELARLERTWGALDGALDDGAAEPVPPGFRTRVMAAVRAEARQEARDPRLSWFAAPAWARAAGALALVAGLAAGAGLGTGLPTADPAPPARADAAAAAGAADLGDDLESLYGSEATTLADDYAEALTLALAGNGGGEES